MIADPLLKDIAIVFVLSHFLTVGVWCQGWWEGASLAPGIGLY